MPYQFKLPDVGEGVAEGEIRRWLVKVGDQVAENQPLVEVMTDKVTVEIPSPKSGTVVDILAAEGQVVQVGAPIITILEKGEAAAPLVAAPTEAPVEPKPVAPKVEALPPTPAPTMLGVLAAPSTRRLARELGVNIDRVTGTGPGGRVTDEDLRRFATTPVAPGPTLQLEERVPLRGIRRRMTESMTRSARTTAPFTLVEEVDMTELVSARERLRPTAEATGIKLTYLPFIIKAVVQALKEHPYLNASLDEGKQEIVLKKRYNIGVATATDEGLVVPVVREADRKSISELAKDVETLAGKARESKLELEDIRDATFSITSLGALGGLFATPIIHHPEVAILGVHRIEKRPAVKGDQIVIRNMAHISLSFDHRIIDGATAARFASRVRSILEEPGQLLSELD